MIRRNSDVNPVGVPKFCESGKVLDLRWLAWLLDEPEDSHPGCTLSRQTLGDTISLGDVIHVLVDFGIIRHKKIQILQWDKDACPEFIIPRAIIPTEGRWTSGFSRRQPSHRIFDLGLEEFVAIGSSTGQIHNKLRKSGGKLESQPLPGEIQVKSHALDRLDRGLGVDSSRPAGDY